MPATWWWWPIPPSSPAPPRYASAIWARPTASSPTAAPCPPSATSAPRPGSGWSKRGREPAPLFSRPFSSILPLLAAAERIDRAPDGKFRPAQQAFHHRRLHVLVGAIGVDIGGHARRIVEVIG